MSAYSQDQNNTYVAGGTIRIHRRVKLSSGSAVEAGAGEAWIGVSQASAASGEGVSVRERLSPGSFFMTAAGVISSGATVYEAADGKVSATANGAPVGIAREAASADNNIIEVLPVVIGQAAVGAPTVSVANAGTPNGNAIVTIQLVNANGTALAQRGVVQVWFAATAYAAPADLGTLTATTGTILVEDTDDALATVVTDANGTAVLQLDTASNGNVHAHASFNGLTGTGSAAITGN